MEICIATVFSAHRNKTKIGRAYKSNGVNMYHSLATNIEDPRVERISVALCVYSELQPEVITKLLGIIPDVSSDKPRYQIAATQRQSSIGKPFWIFDTENRVSSKDIRQHLDYLCDELMLRKSALLRLQKQQNLIMTVNANIWTSSGGFCLWPRQMKNLASLNLEIQFCISDYSVE